MGPQTRTAPMRYSVSRDTHALGRILRFRVAGKEGACADSEVIHTVLNRAAKFRGRARSQVLAEMYEVATRNDQQTISADL